MLTRPLNGVSNNNAREDLITFDPVESQYSAQSDVTLRYTLGPQRTAKPLDWVGIFRSGCLDTDSPLVCQWAPALQTSGVGPRQGRVVFPVKFMKPLADQPDRYQFLYVSESSHILGASQPFKVMDTGDARQMAGMQITSAVAESRDRHSTNQDATANVSISRELMSSDDEWELATRGELCKTNSSMSDLSDIEILSTSPSKDAVKRQVPGGHDDDDDDDDDDDAVDVRDFEKIKTWSLFVDDTPDNGSDAQHVAAAPEALSTIQYPSIMGVRDQEPEIVEFKRKLSRHIKIGSEAEESIVAETAIVKECTKAKKVKKSSIASRNTTKQVNTSNKILNAPIPVAKMQIRNSQTVNNDSSSDNEEYSSLLQNCSIRKRKRKNNTEKSKCQPAVHHTPVSSESDPESNQKASVKRTKRRKRPRVGEYVPPLCDRLTLGDPDSSDCKTAGALDKINRIVGIDKMAGYTKSDQEYANSKTTDQCTQMTCERRSYFDENQIQDFAPCHIPTLACPDKSEVTSRKTRKADENIKYDDALCYTGRVVSPHKMKIYPRKEIDGNTKHRIWSLSPQNMESQNKTIISSQVARNSEENRQNQVISQSLEDFMSSGTVMAHSGNVDEIRKYTVIPLSNESTKYPDKETVHAKFIKTIDDNRKNNFASCKIPHFLYQEETNHRKINTVDENRRQHVAKCKPQIVGSSREAPTNSETMDDCHGTNGDEVYACKLQDVGVAKRTRTNSKLTRVSDASCIHVDTVNMLKVVEFPMRAKADANTPSSSREKLKAPAAVNEQQTEPLDMSKQKLVTQTRISQPAETDCRILRSSEVGSEHLVGEGGCQEHGTEFSSGYVWGVSSIATVASKIPDDCLETVRKRCLRKDKSRTKKATSTKGREVKSGDGIAAVFSGRRQMEEMKQTSIQIIPDTKDTEDLPPNAAEKQESSAQSQEMAERILNVVLNDVVSAGPGTGCREKSMSELAEELLCGIGREDLEADCAAVAAARTSGRQDRKERISSSKVIRASQSPFKAKYKCQGRTSSCQQFLKRGDICKWRKLRRLLMVNKRRFKTAHGVVSPDDIAEFEDTEYSRDSVEPEVTSRAELCPQMPVLPQWSAVGGSTDVGAMDAETRATYASVVKGTKRDTRMLNQEVHECTVTESPYTEACATTQGSTECLSNEIVRLSEPEGRSTSLCYGCVTNVEVSSMQNTDECSGLKCQNNPRHLATGNEFTCDFQTGLSGHVLAGRDRQTPLHPGMERTYCGSSKTGHTVTASFDFGHTMASRTKKTMKGIEKRAGSMRIVQGGVGTAYISPQVDEGAVGDDLTLDWPFPAAFKRTSALKEHPETVSAIPLIAETPASDHRFFTRPTPAVVVGSAGLQDQPQTDHRCPVMPAAVSTSSEFELTSSQAGQIEVVEPDAAHEGPDIGQHPQTSNDSARDDQPLTWPLPISRNSSSKFGLGDDPRDQVDAHTRTSSEFFHRENLPYTCSVSGTALDLISLSAPIQSQMDIPRIRGFPNNSETKAAPSVQPKDHTLGHSVDRCYEDNTDLRHRVNALEKQLDDLNSLLIKHRQEQLHSGGKGDDVAATGCSLSGKFKLVKHKRPPKAKSKGGTRSLARSSVETVSVKSRVRIKETRLADLENQLNIFKEALIATARKPVKIQVKCQKLHVKIRDRKYAINTDPATDGSITVALTQEEGEARGFPLRVDNDGLVQETNLTVGDAPESESHAEGRDGVRSGIPRVEDRCLDYESALRAGSECLVHKSASEVEAHGLLQATMSRAETGTLRVLYRALVPETAASTSRVGYPQLTPETLSSAGYHLQVIPSRVDDCHVAHMTVSTSSSPDLVPGQKAKTLLRVGSPNLIQETPSGSPDLIEKMPSRGNRCRLDDSHSFIHDEATAARGTTGKFPQLSDIQDGNLLELDHQGVFTQYSDADASQVSLVDVSSPNPATHDSPGHPYTKPTHLCSDSMFDVCCCHAHAPTRRLYTSEPNRFTVGSGVRLNRHHDLRMSADMSDGHNDLTVHSSLDKQPLPTSRPDSAIHSPYSRFTYMEKHARDQNDPEMYTATLQPSFSRFRHGARAFCQNSQISLSSQPHPSTSQNHEINTPMDYPYTLYGSHSCRTKFAIQNQEHTLEGDHLKEEFSPWTSITEKTYPEECCRQSAHIVGNDILDSKHKMEKMLKNHASSVNCFLSEDQRCSRHTTNACKHSSHTTSFPSDFSAKHHYSREGSEGRLSPQIPSLSSRFQCVDSAGGDIDARAPFMSFNSRKSKDATLHNGHSFAGYAVDQKTRRPASSKLPESCASCHPCSNSRGQSPNRQVCPCHRKLHNNNHYRNQQRIHSHKQFPKSLNHEIHFQNHHCHSPLCRQQQLGPAFDDIPPSCPFLAGEDAHLLPNNHCLTAQMQHTRQHPLMHFQHSAQPRSWFSRPHQPAREEIAHNLTCGHVLNEARPASTSVSNNCEDQFLDYHHFKQADRTSEDQFLDYHHLKQADPTAEEQLPHYHHLNQAGTTAEDQFPRYHHLQQAGTTAEDQFPHYHHLKQADPAAEEQFPNYHHLKQAGTTADDRFSHYHHLRQAGTTAEDQFPHYHHLKQADPTAEDQFAHYHHLQQAGTTAEEQFTHYHHLQQADPTAEDQFTHYHHLKQADPTAEDQFPHYHHLKQAGTTAEDQFTHYHHLQQADPTAEDQYSAAVTEYLLSRTNYPYCFCLDDCKCKRQIEGKQSCLLRPQT